MRYSAFLAGLLVLSATFLAAPNSKSVESTEQPTPQFTALCKPVGARRYDQLASDEGALKGPAEWSDNERFLDPSPWSLVYDGERTLRVDGMDFVAFPRSPTILSAVSYQPALGADNLKTWTINLNMRRAVYAQLQAGDLLGDHLMARIVEFHCDLTRY